MSPQAADSKREQFRRYLEKSGVLDTLTKGEPRRAAAAHVRALLARWGPPREQRGLGVPWVGRTPAAGLRLAPVVALCSGLKLLQLLQSLSNFRCFPASSRSGHVSKTLRSQLLPAV